MSAVTRSWRNFCASSPARDTRARSLRATILGVIAIRACLPKEYYVSGRARSRISMPALYDLVLANGTLVNHDGGGDGDIGVSEGRIAAIGRIPAGQGART